MPALLQVLVILQGAVSCCFALNRRCWRTDCTHWGAWSSSTLLIASSQILVEWIAVSECLAA